jgi:UDP-N-acetylglucosamine/UDP-N-acetylgalactosamine diphosphorylase
VNGPARDWRAILVRHGQQHVWDHLAGLDPVRRAALERELAALDFDLLDELVASLSRPVDARLDPASLRPPATIRAGADPVRDAAMATVGEEALARGRVACVLVAGGQGSRLGHAGPKGTYPATPVRGKPLFQVFAEKLRAREQVAGRAIPFAVMTSAENDADTRAFFETHRFFGLAREQVRFFIQGMLPAVDESGRLVLRSPGALFLSPNGHGGTLLALAESGLLDAFAREGVEDIFYFQVDNPLVELCDPVFLGFHRTAGSEFSSKVVAKAGPGEKVGVLAESGGRMTLIEYSDLDPALREARNADGSLVYSAGNIAIHVLGLEFARRLTKGRLRLPFHLARKKLDALGPDGARAEVPGIKFETFIFDALSDAANPLALEVRREAEFAPIKNATGSDSAATSRALQSAAAARMLEAAGVAVPRGATGEPAVPIEISPLFATHAAGLRAKLRAPPAFDRPLYLGDD